ncbi:UDP-4-amino-4,6-dideoxy-N-acetyl-beta-L-altrosamine transaminase [Aliiglaciecola sp. LCG003]|uniref:UDP-4-amino-4, 6-dideoxy-N-acetyl-beta-L-altrosamine transaminase n=1 Tax=Aliiglaciecola sp. LCG003 TaxID=3053655 RepID=UPI0025731D9E|nr:UDP-4-amino-4,6-dideoxy-N-acetyl-beta-L-altrosamine transaminase [Aliiglaciecola sp. LCG003]WJG10569.1 UDP-4-amino-4,6-dideoxy-N-acetyl-beta-L-altrosamine transaminase [Aliiglaciecola sp. LCG003]
MADSQAFIPYGRHHIDDKDIDAVIDVLKNQFLTQGAKAPEFEQALCAYTGAKYATAVNSATSGLHVACLALGVGSGDTVWTVPNSFVASANCALYCNAQIDFVDIDPVTRNISIEALQDKLKKAKSRNKLPKVLIPVHFSGVSCDMRAIALLAKEYGFSVIEDAAHGLGGNYLDHKIGSCEFSDITVLSFHPVKSITTAEGGALLTNDAGLDKKAKLIAKHGVTRDPELMEGESEGPWYYQQVALGFNYRMSDLHAALGITQLQKLDDFVTQRRAIVARYNQALNSLPLKLPLPETLSSSAWHLYMIELTDHDRKATYQALHAKGIGVNVHYIPIHLQPYYQQLGFKAGEYPQAEAFYKNALTLPLFPGLTADEQDRVIQALNEVLA